MPTRTREVSEVSRSAQTAEKRSATTQHKNLRKEEVHV